MPSSRQDEAAAVAVLQLPAAPAAATPVALARLRVRHLQLLDALQRLGSLRRVARELGCTQAATLSLIDDLEFAFGLPLVAREHSGTTLTRAAHAIVGRLSVAVQEVMAARQSVARSARSGGRVRVGVSPYLISTLVPELTLALRLRLPTVEIDIREGTLDMLVGDLRSGSLDAVLGSVDRATVLSSDGVLDATLLFAEELCLVAGRSHPLHGLARSAGLDELLAGPWVLPHASSHLRTLFDSAVIEQGGTPVAPEVECRGILNLLAIAASAGMLTVAPRLEATKPVWTGRVAPVTTELRMKAPPYAFVCRRYAVPAPEVTALRACAVDVAQRFFKGLPAAPASPPARRARSAARPR